MESLATQTLIIFAIHTRRVPFFRSRASVPLTITSLTVVALGVLITISPLARPLGFTPLPLQFFGALAGFVVAYLSYTVMVAAAAGIVLIPGAPLGLITTAVQALAGLLLPSASVFLLLLCNDREVLGPWVNRRWLNVVAVFIVSVLLLSGILMATTLFPHLNVVAVAEYLAAAILVLVVMAVGALQWSQRRRPTTPASPPVIAGPEKMQWRMPPLALLEPVTWSAGTKLGMLALRSYLVIAILLVVKAVQLGGG